MPKRSFQAAGVVIAWVLLGACGSLNAVAQTATLSGFVTDARDGRSLEGASVTLSEPGEADSLRYGAAVNADGAYLIRGIRPGTYVLAFSHVGYVSIRDTVTLDGRVTRSVALTPSESALDEVLIQAERRHGMARITAGHQRILPEEIELVPSPDLSADLATYLTTLPGIVTTGDRGGQFYVRGGEPSQNLVLLDGMIVYQPFHVLGFYSAFPADLLSHVDLYAGGYPPRYAGRLSSVVDVAARRGNDRRLAGMASASPFAGALRFEGPIVPGHASFLISARESMLERGAERIVGKDLPFRFGDLFAKVYGPLSTNSRLSISALRTHDRGRIGEPAEGEPADEVRWRNEAIGARWTLVPKSIPMIMTVELSHSRHHTELGPADEPLRRSDIRHSRIAVDGSFQEGRLEWEGGFDALLGDVTNDLNGAFQLPEVSGKSFVEWGLYVQPVYRLGPGLRLMPSARLQWYAVRIDPFIEPRIRLTWERGIHYASGALGLYNQAIVGINDRRDVANVFTIWSVIPRPEDRSADPRKGRLGKSLHATLGYRSTPASWLEMSVEGFYKRMSNLFVAEWTSFPELTTRLSPARGRTAGFELRLEVRRAPFYGFVNYGYSNTLYHTKYEAVRYWFGTESLAFRPPHDRRHQVTALGSASALGLDFSVRWTFGSGLPYTQPLAFDSFVYMDHAGSIFDMHRSRRVIFDRPFNAILPAYHRLDLSVERTFPLGAADLTIQASLINACDRPNLFYVDTFTTQRADQLPIIPSFGLRVSF